MTSGVSLVKQSKESPSSSSADPTQNALNPLATLWNFCRGLAGEGNAKRVVGGEKKALVLGRMPDVASMRGSGKGLLAEIVLMLVGVTASSAALYFIMRKFDPNVAQSRLAKRKKREIARRLGRPMIETNQYEDSIACDVINPEDMDVTFASIGGLEDVKQALHELIILPLQRPELFARGNLLKPQKGVLLYGPPGTGKTLLAKAVAKECGAAFINVRVSSLMSKWFGDAQKLVTAVFTLAHKLQPAIIFMDEIDSLLGQRKATEHEAFTSMKTEFMSLWDGFSTDENARVMVLCATNRPWDLDEAILRRLPRAFEIPLPDARGRADILRVVLRDELLEDGFGFDAVAGQCNGYSGSDLIELCKQAAFWPVRDFLRAEAEMKARPLAEQHSVERRPLRTADFLGVLRDSPPAREAAEEYRRSRERAQWAANPRESGGHGPGGVGAADSQAAAMLRALFMVLSSGGAAASGSHASANGIAAGRDGGEPQGQSGGGGENGEGSDSHGTG